MREMPRLRKVVKWGAAVLTVTTIVLWVASGKLYVGYIGDKAGLAMFAGQIEASLETGTGGMPFNYAGREGWQLSESKTWKWRIGLELFMPIKGYGTRGVVYVPVWMLALVPMMASIWAWRRDSIARRRRAIGACLKCSYDRHGLPPTAPCPECGHAAPAPTS